MTEVTLRPMRPEDADDVTDVTVDAFAAAAERARDDAVQRTPELQAAMRRRFHHSVATDAGGCWVAERDGRPVGAAVALRREGLWVLSLLMVRGEVQGHGVGRALLDRALAYGGPVERGIIAASLDPAAWRRYWAAGFRLLPCAQAKGRVDRDALPRVSGVRDGRAEDVELAHEVARGLRGASHGPDLEFLVTNPTARFLVADGAGDRGFALTFHGSPALVGAERPETAQRLLWSALAESGDETGLYFVDARQEWAFDVLFRSGLSVRSGTALFVRGELGPLCPYLPNGPFL